MQIKRPEGIALALAVVMSDISEGEWAAGWLIGLEFMLWERVVTNSPGSDEDSDMLRDLATAAGGWIRFNECVEGFREFVPMAEWLNIYADHKRSEPH